MWSGEQEGIGMARFKPSLMDKVEKEQRQEIKQEKLKAESGIKEEEVLVKEKSGSDYGKAVFRFVVDRKSVV